MAFDFKTFLTTVPCILDARLPVLIRGRHGVGKSEVVYMIAKQRSLPVVERRASQMTEGDLLGLPDTADLSDGRKATTWNAPDWLVTACTEPVVLFLDEVDRATMEVRQGLFELTDSRKINGWHLHPETLILAAVNGGEHGSQYQVGEMDPAELDRWTVFDVEPSVEDWLEWASGKVNGVLWDFVNHNRQHLEHSDDYEPNKVYPSRRSWVRFASTTESLGLFEAEGNRDLLLNLAETFVGFEAAVALRDFVQKYEYQVTIEDILVDGSFDKIQKWGINDHAAMVEKMEHADTFKERLPDEQLVNLATWFVSMPSEICMKLWTVIGDSEDENGANAIRLHRSTAADGTRVSEHMVKILRGD
tara:strand:- start:2678 stop:3760 length:1083 start_codon:yes stop_codon:yes gene_type:complete